MITGISSEMTEEPNNLTSEAEASIETDDIVLEDNVEVTGADAQAKVSNLKTQIKELQKKNAELLDAWQRDKADFINTRKRDEADKQEFVKFSNQRLIEDLLPVLDAFESAMKNKEAWEKVDKNWRVGVEYIQSQLGSILGQNGLKTINPTGGTYDPKRDEAVEMVKIDKPEDEGKILEVVQLGYELNGKEIRAPKVRIAHFE